MSKIILNVVEPGTTPVDPAVPNTGLFTNGIGGPEAAVITVSIVLVLAIAAAVLYYKKRHNKNNKVNKLANTLSILKTKKKLSIPLTVLALVVSLSTLAILLVNAGKNYTSAAEADEELTLNVSDQELTIEVGNEPVFAVIPIELTVKEATRAGYTLTAYTDSTDLVSITDDSNIIHMITVDEDKLAALAGNTYGLSLSEPVSQNDETFTTLSTDADKPTFISDKNYEATEDNDTITIYYGFYITPDIPHGVYNGNDTVYKATANEAATVIFEGNGLYFNGDETQTTNTVNYTVGVSDKTEKYSHTSNIDDDGVVSGQVGFGVDINDIINIPDAVKLHIKYTYGGGINTDDGSSFGSFWQGSHSDYTPIADYSTGIQNCGGGAVTDGRYYNANGTGPVTVECDIIGDTVTFGYWTNPGGPSFWDPDYGYYAVITGYDADDNIIYLPKKELVGGDYLVPSSETYSRFLGWDKNKDATTPTYITKNDIEEKLELAFGTSTTLYAIWQQGIEITYHGNGADDKTNMNNIEQHGYAFDLVSAGFQVDLLASNFTKDGYGFVGWSTDTEAWDHLTDNDSTNDPAIYGPNQTITIDENIIAEAGENRRLVLNAVWAPAEADNSGNPVSLQDWQGCSTLTPTTYDSTTNTLSVGKNTITALTDNRDGNIYTVARLADGNCWMTENLRLDNEPELSQQNTNNPSLPLTNDYAEQITSNKLSPSSDNWCTSYDDPSCVDQSRLNTNNTALVATSPVFDHDFTDNPHEWHVGGLNDNIYSYGNYYNWYSATAGNGKYETSSGVTVAGDICPAGWHLPYGGGRTSSKGNTSGGFYYLNQQMGGNTSAQGSNNWRSFPNNFIYAGEWSGVSAYNQGDYAYYWSSTSHGNGYAYLLLFLNNGVYPSEDSRSGVHGVSVRCVTSVE